VKLSMKKVMFASTGSGRGKTTITCSVLMALKKRGLNVRAFKCGPDYIDPLFHEKVLMIKSKNLDTYFTDADTTRRLFALDNDGDLSVIEGVMGLYDGITIPKIHGSLDEISSDETSSDEASSSDGSSFETSSSDGSSSDGSSYELARVTNAPVILIVDASGMGRSLIAEIAGFLSLDYDKRIKGVILNRISASYYSVIKGEIENALNICLVGFFPKTDKINLKSRHLGLMLPDEIKNLTDMLDSASMVAEECLDIDKIISIAQAYDSDCTGDDNNKSADIGIPVDMQMPVNTQMPADMKISAGHEDEELRVAYAYDEAFCFYYEDNLRLLREAGITLVPFSPVHDDRLPDNISGLILGGGYPENYLEELSLNKTMLSSVRRAIDSGIPSLAECGGFMYLHDTVCDTEGRAYSLVGTVKGKCEYKDRLIRFGYMSIEEKKPSFMKGFSDSLIKGHEFHYYDSTNNGDACLSVKPSGKIRWESAHVSDNHWWGFAHLYYPSNPHFVEAFVKKVRNADRYLDQSHRFFINRDCKYYPCHEGIKDINCLFCYCPMYGIENCPGNPKKIEREGKIIKKCTYCTFPHRAGNYDIIMKVLKENR